MSSNSPRFVRTLQQRWMSLGPGQRLTGVAIVGAIIIGGLGLVGSSTDYHVNQQAAKLLDKPYAGAAKIKQTATAFEYNKSLDGQKPAGKGNFQQAVLAASKTDASGDKPYVATLPKNPSNGLTFGTATGDLNFKVVSLNNTGAGQLQNNRIVYPGAGLSQHVYSFKRNGIKADILLDRAPGNTATYTWELELGDKLEARLLPDGSVGVYSADQNLYGDITVADDKSQNLLNKARTKGAKTHLAFILPRPFIKDATGALNYADVAYALKGQRLTLSAKNLRQHKYPLSIDPTIVVTTSADFKAGSDDGSINYATANEAGRAVMPQHNAGAWTASTTFTTGRRVRGIAYNGYLYLAGGYDGATYYNDVQYAPINTDGTVGTWAATTSFTTGRYGNGVVANNGYLYIIGGNNGSTYYNDVQYAPINSDGSIGTWSTTSALSNTRSQMGYAVYGGYVYVIGGLQDAVTLLTTTNYARFNSDGTLGSWTLSPISFTTSRSNLVATAYNGYLYLIGGRQSTNYYSDVQYAQIFGDGSIGAWSTTSSMTTVRALHTGTIYNGRIYIVGGYNSSVGNLNTAEFASFNSNGTLSAWTSTAGFEVGTYDLGLGAHAGHLYMFGGNIGSYSNTSYYAPIGANGHLGHGAPTTSSFSQIRQNHATVAYNGYLYILGGYTGSGSTMLSDVNYAQIKGDGSLGAWAATTSFTTARRIYSVVAYNGYMYLLGGADISAALSDTQYAKINANGTLGTWTASTSLPASRAFMPATAHNGYLYVLGGRNGFAFGTYFNTVYYAPINANGSIGTWNTTSTFTTARGNHAAFVHNGRMYIGGGYNGTANLSDVQYATINGDGTLGTWASTTSMSATRRNQAMVVVDGKAYSMGGTTTVGISTIEYATINGDGTIGTWTTTTPMRDPTTEGSAATANGYIYYTGGTDMNLTNTLNTTTVFQVSSSGGVIPPGMTFWTAQAPQISSSRSGHAAVAMNGYIYVLGGHDGTTNLNNVEYSAISASGTLGAWTQTTAFTNARRDLTAFVWNGRVYVLGGNSGATYYSDVQYAAANADGSLGSWQSTTSFSTGRTQLTATAFNGYAYVAGGYDGTSRYNDVQYAAINSDGSITSWATTNSFTTARSDHSMSAYNGYLYIIGGYDGSSHLSSTQYAVINGDGTLGTWAATTALPASRSKHAGLAANGYMYASGGTNGTDLYSTVLAPINTNGTLGTWVEGANMAVARSNQSLVYVRGQLYASGGENAGTYYSDTLVAGVTTPALVGSYERLIDMGKNSTVTAIQVQGQTQCGYSLQYKTAANLTSSWSAVTTVSGLLSGTNISVTIPSARYLMASIQLDDATCGGISTVTDITITYQADAIAAPLTNPAGAPYLRGFDGTNVFGTSNTVTIPANTEGGDGLYLVTSGSWPAPTSISGWTRVVYQTGANWLYGVYYRAAAGTPGSISSEAGTTVTVTHTSGPHDIQTALYAVAGSAAAPIVNTAYSSSAVATATVNFSANQGDLVLYMGSGRRNSSLTITIDGGVTDLTRSADASSGMVMGHETPYAGAMSRTFTPNSPASSGSVGYVYVALQIPISQSLYTNQSVTPTLTARSPQLNNSYLQYKFDVCSTSDCSSIVRTIDQTASQTGWTGQDQQTNTAYTGSSNLSLSTLASHAYQAPALAYGTTYYWRAYAIDPADANLWSQPSAIQSFTTNATPAAPVLTAPLDTATNAGTTPQLQFSATDADSDYLQYKIDLCSNSDCSSIISTFDQTASQTGWSGQTEQSGTAYSGGPVSSQVARYTLQSALSTSTQYWWRAYAIDPAGSNAWSAPSSIFSFTTGNGLPNDKLQLNGNTVIRGGTRFGN